VSAELDRYLDELGRRLRLSGARRARALEEARDHLAESDADAATLSAAIARFGEPAEVARSFNAGHSTRRLRRSPVLGIAVGVWIFASMALAARSSATPWQAPVAAIVLFSTAVVAAQLALAGGLVLCGRLTATMGERTISAREAELARRGALLLYVGEAVAAGLLVATIVADDVARGSVPASMIAGGALIALAGVAGALGARRLARFAPVSVEAIDDESLSPPARWAWRGFDVVARHPGPSCAVVAALAAAGSANHAESSVVLSLPWAAGQAIVVVAGFLALRGWLGLRGEDSSPVAA
jgi:hypothetical protein